MRHVGILIVLLAVGAVQAFGQTSVDDAAAKLKAKQQQREVERAKMVQITAGELEDLRATVKRLDSELASIRKQTAQAQQPKRRFTEIELGMTRQELMTFITAHRNLKVVSISSNAGVTGSTEQTVVKRQQATNGNTITNNTTEGPGPSRATSQQTLTGSTGDSAEKTQIERKTLTGKKETIVVGIMDNRSVVSGYHTNVLGGQVTDYATEVYQRSSIRVELVNDTVTLVEAGKD